MNDNYAYRTSRQNKIIWLSAAAVAALMAYGFTYEVPHTFAMVTILIFVIIGWQMMTNNVRGILVDDNRLTLNAWRNPKIILLDDIAYLRAEHWTDDSAISIVYKDGTEEGTNPRDMPSLATLTEVMAARGIKVKDPSGSR